ncbi:unnamed protein product, partial [Prorocentrum cordatum]
HPFPPPPPPPRPPPPCTLPRLRAQFSVHTPPPAQRLKTSRAPLGIPLGRESSPGVASSAASPSMSEDKTAGIDEEDEFEEFEEPDWETPPAGKDNKQWEEDWDDAGWDDEDQDDSFQKRLKEELDRMDTAKPAAPPS